MKTLEQRVLHACTALALAASAALPTLVVSAIASAPAHAAARGTAAPARSPGSGGAETKNSPVDINTADVEALIDLPGIGRAVAQRIVDYRKEHGPFKSVDELLNVRGIGDRLLARVRDRVRVGSKE